MPEKDMDGREGELYRCGPMLRLGHGAGHELLHFPLVGKSIRASSLVASALDRWGSFRTIDEALTQIKNAMPSIQMDLLTSVVQKLASDRCLIARSLLFDSFPAPTDSCPGRNVSWLAISTSDRISAAQRALSSYIENIRGAGRTCKIFVSDDSRSVEQRIRCVDISRSFEAETGIEITYAGSEDKKAFTKKLTEKGDLPPDVVEYALFGLGHSFRTPGANRNAILLQTIESLCVSVDDDTICRPAVAPGTTDNLVMSGHWSPAETWCFSKSEAALAFGTAVKVDVVGEHQRILGRSVSDVLSDANAGGRVVEVDQMCTHLLTSVLSRSGRIRATFNGARGDSGFHSDLGHVSSKSKATRHRIQDLGEHYQASLESRQTVRQSLHATISHPDPAALAMCMGLDNTELLPAFMPEGNNEDGVFAAVLGLSSDHHYVGHVPFTVAHEPGVGRRYAENRDTSVRISDVVKGCLSTWRPAPGVQNTAQRTNQMGRYLEDIGTLPSKDFDEFLHVLMCARIASTIESLESLLVEDGYQPIHWAEDLEKRIESLRGVTDHYDCFDPVDLVTTPGDPPKRVAQRIIARYGQLLQWWPAITERAIELMRAGVTIGRCLNVK